MLKHKCKVCETFFTQRCNLLQQIKTVHIQVRSFVCIICDKTFTQSGNLTREMRTHTKETSFVCQFCKKLLLPHQVNQIMKLELTHKFYLMLVKLAGNDLSNLRN